MCNCKKTNGFKEKINEATILQNQTNEVHAVFVLNGVVFCCKESELSDELGICCYFLIDGTEVVYTKKSINEIEVIDAEIENSRLAKKKEVKV